MSAADAVEYFEPSLYIAGYIDYSCNCDTLEMYAIR